VPSTSYDDDGRATVEFRLPPEAALDHAWLSGEFNAWATDAEPLQRQGDGSLVTRISLEPGAYRFRYYLGDGEWENDWAADAYVDNEHGGQDSVVVVPPAPAPPPPVGDAPVGAASAPVEKPATEKAVTEKAATKKAASKKTAAPVKKAAAKKAPAKKAPAKKAGPPG
jgi:hypothetical protein